MSFHFTIEDYPHYTYKDYEKWEGDWELIRGIPYAMAPSASWQHQDFGSDFIQQFKNALHKKPSCCECKVLYESDWIVTEDTIVRPDVMIVCEPIQGTYVTKPPSLILEILSPATVLKDRNTKYNLYQAYDVQYYLVADIGKKIINTYHLVNNSYQQMDDLKISIFPKTAA